MKISLKAALAFPAALALVVLTLTPASAQAVGDVAITIESPASGSIVSGTQNISVKVDSTVPFGIQGQPAAVERIAVSIRDNSGNLVKAYPHHNFVCSLLSDNRSEATEHVVESWDTKTMTPYNGVYDIFVQVKRCDNVDPNNYVDRTQEDIKVNNAPAQPRNVNVSEPKQGDQKLTVSWSKNAEPDITGYRITRSVAGADYDEVAFEAPTSTSFGDSGLPFEKTIKYQVVAYRKSPVTAGRGIASAAATTESVSIPKPPPPPTASPEAAKAAAAAAAKKAGPLDRLSTASSPSNPLAPVGIDGRPEPRGITGGIGFNSRLPFDESIPSSFQDEQTITEKAGEILSNPGKAIGEQLRINPVRFFAAGTLLLVAAGHLARAARRLLISDPDGASPGLPGSPIPA